MNKQTNKKLNIGKINKSKKVVNCQEMRFEVPEKCNE